LNEFFFNFTNFCIVWFFFLMCQHAVFFFPWCVKKKRERILSLCWYCTQAKENVLVSAVISIYLIWAYYCNCKKNYKWNELWILPWPCCGEQSEKKLKLESKQQENSYNCRHVGIRCPVFVFLLGHILVLFWCLCGNYALHTGTWILCSERRWVTLHFWSNCETAMVLCMCKATYWEAYFWSVNLACIIFVTM
jgi:hypothetical protein